MILIQKPIYMSYKIPKVFSVTDIFFKIVFS